MRISEWAIAVASIILDLGVLLAWSQLRLTKQQAVTNFEDRLTTEYRRIILHLPIPALLGEAIDLATLQDKLADFYQYIDLTNQQIFLRRTKRISDKTWNEWSKGILWNFSRPAFASAWDEIHRRDPDSFEELRRMLETKDDPINW